MTWRYSSPDLPDVTYAMHSDYTRQEWEGMINHQLAWDSLENRLRSGTPAGELAYDVRRRAFLMPSGMVRAEVDIRAAEQ